MRRECEILGAVMVEGRRKGVFFESGIPGGLCVASPLRVSDQVFYQ